MDKNNGKKMYVILGIIMILFCIGVFSFIGSNVSNFSINPVMLKIPNTDKINSVSDIYDLDDFFNSSEATLSSFVVFFAFAVTVIQVVFYVLIWVLIIKFIVNIIRRKSNHNYFKTNVVFDNNSGSISSKKSNRYVDVKKDKLSTFNTDDLNSLKQYFYDIFLRFEMAYNNLDYNVMKMLSTKQLFQNYYTGISLDLKVGKKRIIENIQKENVIIYELDSTIAKQTVCAMIEVTYINYVIDRNGYVISGDRNNPMKERFEVTFRKDFEKNDITKCPNCGATISGNKCNYCRSTIKNVEFKISSIKKIIEK